MELGTIIITGRSYGNTHMSPRPGGQRSRTLSGNSSIVLWDILGQSILQRTINRLRDAHTGLISVFNQEQRSSKPQPEAWEKAVLDYARSGVERILLVSLGAYSEVDYRDLLRFHLENRSLLTNVSDDQGPLGILIVEAKAVDSESLVRNRLSALASCSSSYEFSGYCNRLDTAADYRRLALHGLTSLCELKPVGNEIAPGIWVGDGARINKSARVLGPTYIGAGSRVRPGVLVAGGSSIERNCDIDCGTVIENSSILPRTYLGPGLHVNQSLVNGSRLTHLGRNLEVELGETNLLGWSGNRTSRRLLETLGSLFTFGTEPAPTLSTPTRAPASLDYVRSQGFFD